MIAKLQEPPVCAMCKKDVLNITAFTFQIQGCLEQTRTEIGYLIINTLISYNYHLYSNSIYLFACFTSLRDAIINEYFYLK